MQRVRQVAAALKPLAVGEDRRAIIELLSLLDRGWVVDDDWHRYRRAHQRPPTPRRPPG